MRMPEGFIHLAKMISMREKKEILPGFAEMEQTLATVQEECQ